MCTQVKAIKNGEAIDKPIYNHVSGLLDPPETIKPPKVFVIEGLHPLYDERVRKKKTKNKGQYTQHILCGRCAMNHTYIRYTKTTRTSSFIPMIG